MDRTDLKIIKADSSEIPLFSKSPLRYCTTAKFFRTVAQDDYVDVVVESAEPLDLNLEDRLSLDGNDYILNLTPVSTKNSRRNFVYSLRFEGPIYLLRKIQVFNRDSQNRKTEFNFNLVRDLEGFIDMILLNANHYQSVWVKGNVPTGTIEKNIYFGQMNCLSALNLIAEEYGVEYYAEKSGSNYVLHVGEIGTQSGLTFQYGQGKGLYSLERSAVGDSEVVTRLYGFGSTENIPPGYRDFSMRLRMPEATGDYIEDQLMINLFGFVEAVHESDIKPEFSGTIDSVGALTQRTAIFSSADIDFDLAEEDGMGNTLWLIDGQPAKVSFLTGKLAGYEFDVFSYDHATRTIEIERYTDERGLTIPDTGAFAVEAGDTFTFLDIIMPPSYIADAEARLQAETEAEYERLTKTNIKYRLTVDPLFMRGKTIGIGDTVHVTDVDLGVDREIRILGLEYDILEDRYVFDLSDVYEPSFARRIVTTINNNNRVYKEFRDRSKGDISLNKINIRDLDQKLFDGGDTLVPSVFGVETISREVLMKDARPTQMGVEGVVYYLNDGGDENSIRLSDGSITNFGINNAITTWNMPPLDVSGLDPSKSYFVYAKADKETTSATWLVTDQEINIDEDPDYFHFITGVVYKPEGGERKMDVIHGSLPDEKAALPEVNYITGPSNEIDLGEVVPGILDMSEEDQAKYVRLFRNGVKMRITELGFSPNNFYLADNGTGGVKAVFQIPLTGNDQVEINLYE